MPGSTTVFVGRKNIFLPKINGLLRWKQSSGSESINALGWITPGVGSALSGFFTAFGAIVAVYIAHRFFGGKLNDLKSTVRDTENLISSFRASVESQFAQFDHDIKELNAVTGGLQETAARTQAAVYEVQENSEDVAADDASSDQIGITSMDADNKEKVRTVWDQIANHLEEIASSEFIDGRTRAKYARIDRRSYYSLISALDSDGRLNGAAQAANSAAELWYRCRRLKQVSANEVSQLKQLRDLVLNVAVPAEQ